MDTRTTVIVAAACVFAAAAGYGLYTTQEKAPVSANELPISGPFAGPVPAPVAEAPSGVLDKAPAGMKLVDLEGKTHGFEDWQGKLLVVNFWATWCGPCLHEIPALIKIQEQYGAKGFQIVGPAVDDVEAVKAQAPKLGFNYPVLIGSSDDMLDLMTQLGNTSGALPFSVVIAPDGKILQRQLGEFSAVELAGLIEEQLAKKP